MASLVMVGFSAQDRARSLVGRVRTGRVPAGPAHDHPAYPEGGGRSSPARAVAGPGIWFNWGGGAGSFTVGAPVRELRRRAMEKMSVAQARKVESIGREVRLQGWVRTR